MTDVQDPGKQLRQVFALARKLKFEIECLYSVPDLVCQPCNVNDLISLEELIMRIYMMVAKTNEDWKITPS